jgi:hypothetical protein
VSTPQEIRDVLLKAAALVEPEGAWTQGTFRDGGARCMVGAINDCAGEMTNAEYRELSLTVAEAVGCESLTMWNDAAGRTQAEVVAALRKAADLAVEAHS